MEDRILIVGGAGYIGGAITDILLKEYPSIKFKVYDNLMFERDYRKEVEFIYGDVRDIMHIKKVITDFNPTSIIWLAALVGDGACQAYPDLTISINQKSVEWLSKNYDGRIVYTSTCSTYGKNDKILDEESETNPLSLYAITKIQCERYLKDKNAIIFRLGTLHGVSDDFSRIRLDLVVNVLSLKAICGQPLTVFGGEQWRPLLHVKDAAQAITKAALIFDSNIKPGIYNLCQKNMTIREVAEEISKVCPIKTNLEYSDISFEDARNYRVDSSKYDNLKCAIKFKRTVSDGAKEIINLIKSNRIRDPNNKIFHNARFMEEFKDVN